MRVGPALLQGRSGPAAFYDATKPTHGRGWALPIMPFMSSESPFLKLARDRVVILDGAMGTSLHRYHPTDADWGHGPDGKSLHEPLGCTGLHASGMDRGDSSRLLRGRLRRRRDEHVQRQHRSSSANSAMVEQLDEINRPTFASRRRLQPHIAPRTGRGSSSAPSGPAPKCRRSRIPPSDADFDALAEAYRPQIAVMIEEGVDAILIETCFDILQAKMRGHHRHRGDEAGAASPAADGATHHHRRKTRRCSRAPTFPRRSSRLSRSTRST